MEPGFSLRVPAPAAIAAAAYLGLALLGGGRLPLVEKTMFRFSVPQVATVVPLFLADGERARAEDFVNFVNLPPEVVDLEHHGYECSVEHKLHEQKNWLAAHQAAAGAAAGPVSVALGVQLLSIGPNGKVKIEERIDARGTAHRWSP